MFCFIESTNGNGGGEQRVLNEEHLTVSHILSRTQKTQNQQRKRESYFEKYFLVFFIIYHSTNKKKQASWMQRWVFFIIQSFFIFFKVSIDQTEKVGCTNQSINR